MKWFVQGHQLVNGNASVPTSLKDENTDEKKFIDKVSLLQKTKQKYQLFMRKSGQKSGKWNKRSRLKKKNYVENCKINIWKLKKKIKWQMIYFCPENDYLHSRRTMEKEMFFKKRKIRKGRKKRSWITPLFSFPGVKYTSWWLTVLICWLGLTVWCHTDTANFFHGWEEKTKDRQRTSGKPGKSGDNRLVPAAAAQVL